MKIRFGKRRDRVTLGFETLVVDNFRFLVDSFGFALKDAEPTRVIYKSLDVYVIVFHGRGSYQVDFEMGLISSGVPGFRLADLSADVSSGPLGGRSSLQASDHASLEAVVPQLAQFLQAHATDGLLGKRDFFETLDMRRQVRAASVTQGYVMQSVRERAESAWKDRRFADYVVIMEPHLPLATRAEMLKYDYCRKRKLPSGPSESDKNTQ